MLVEVLQQLSKFEILLKKLESYLINHGIEYRVAKKVNKINDFSVRIFTIFQIVTMFGNLHRQLQQLQD